MDNTELLINNVYTPTASSCNGHYSPSLDHLLTSTDSLVLGDFNAQHSLGHSGTTDTTGNQLADSTSISRFAVLNADSPTRLPGNTDPSCCLPRPPCLFGGVLPYIEVTGHPVSVSSIGLKCPDCFIWNCSYIVYPSNKGHSGTTA